MIFGVSSKLLCQDAGYAALRRVLSIHCSRIHPKHDYRRMKQILNGQQRCLGDVMPQSVVHYSRMGLLCVGSQGGRVPRSYDVLHRHVTKANVQDDSTRYHRYVEKNEAHKAVSVNGGNHVAVVSVPGASTGHGEVTPLSQLERGDVHMWWMRIPDGSEYQRDLCDFLCHEDVLDPGEVAEMRHVLGNDVHGERRQSLIARGYLRSVLVQYANMIENSPIRQIVPSNITFGRNKHGKPEVSGVMIDGIFRQHRVGLLRFNLTHSAGVVGVGVSLVDDIGIDVELVDRQTRKSGNEMKLAKRYFSEKELQRMMDMDEGSRLQYFVKLWTMKEAYVKAVGRGIGASPGFRSFSFSLEDEGSINFTPSSEEPDKNWHCYMYTLWDSHVGALCHEQHVPLQQKSLTAFISEGDIHESGILHSMHQPLLAWEEGLVAASNDAACCITHATLPTQGMPLQ